MTDQITIRIPVALCRHSFVHPVFTEAKGDLRPLLIAFRCACGAVLQKDDLRKSPLPFRKRRQDREVPLPEPAKAA
jgi:hypothetical protein